MLNLAAAVSTVSRRSARARVFFLALLAVGLCAVSANAETGIDVGEQPAAETQAVCPALTEIKYPFLPCTEGKLWDVDSHATWENSRRIPLMSEWTESDGAWGPDLNGN